MSVKEDCLKGFEERYVAFPFQIILREPMEDAFLKGAKWAFERSAKEADHIGQSGTLSDLYIGNIIRSLSKELDVS